MLWTDMLWIIVSEQSCTAADNCTLDRIVDADDCRVADNGRQVGLVAGQLELPGGRELP